MNLRGMLGLDAAIVDTDHLRPAQSRMSGLAGAPERRAHKSSEGRPRTSGRSANIARGEFAIRIPRGCLSVWN